MIVELQVDGDLEITWPDGFTAPFSCLWLRDNARDPISFDSRSNQRELFTAGLPGHLRPVSVYLSEDRDNLLIEWGDVAEPVIYPGAFLRQYAQPASNRRAAALWTQQPVLHRLPLATLKNESPFAGASLAKALSTEGFAVITDCPPDDQSVSTIAGFLGYVRETIFGGIWRFEANEAMADSAYTPKELRPHTDGTYSLDAPGVQILLCLENSAIGGESILVDGYAVAEQIREATPEVFEDLCRIEIEGCYQGDGVRLTARRPIIRLVDGDIQQVSFNNYDRAPMYLPPEEMWRMYRAIKVIDEKFNDPANQWRYSLQTGEALVFDNWRVLHGRSAFSGQRRMAGAYVNREDVVSFQSKVLNPSF